MTSRLWKIIFSFAVSVSAISVLSPLYRNWFEGCSVRQLSLYLNYIFNRKICKVTSGPLGSKITHRVSSIGVRIVMFFNCTLAFVSQHTVRSIRTVDSCVDNFFYLPSRYLGLTVCTCSADAISIMCWKYVLNGLIQASYCLFLSFPQYTIQINW